MTKIEKWILDHYTPSKVVPLWIPLNLKEDYLQDWFLIVWGARDKYDASKGQPSTWAEWQTKNLRRSWRKRIDKEINTLEVSEKYVTSEFIFSENFMESDI